MKAKRIINGTHSEILRTIISNRLVWRMLFAWGITVGSVHADLVGRWALDEGVGDLAYDSSTRTNDGTVVNATWGSREDGFALSFDGTAHLDIPAVSWGTIDQQVTLAFWVYGDSDAQPQDNFTVGAFTDPENNEARALSAHIPWGNGNVYFDTGGTVAGGYDRIFKAASPHEYEEWQHWALVKDAEIGEQSIYLNARLWHSASGMDRPIGGMDVTGFTIGAKPNHADFFVGRIDDVQLYDVALTQEEILWAMEGIPHARGQAYSPSPVGSDVQRDVVLGWTPGEFAIKHNVYVGKSFEDVDTATTPIGAGLSVNSFDPGRLEFGRTYYWRVDEVNGTPDKTVFKGEVWSFTVEPYSIPIAGSEIIATASSSSDVFSLPEKTTDGSGLSADGKHAITPESMWFTTSFDMAPWIQYEFDEVKKLDVMKVWNSNSAAEIAIGWGVKDVKIEYSLDGENWDVLPGVNQFSRAPGLPIYDQYDEIVFGGVAAKFVRLNIQSNWGGILMSYGLSEVQFAMISAQARTPDPADGSVDVLPNAVVTWRAGHAADHHTIYVSTDATAVANGSAPSVSSTTNGLDLTSLDVQLGQTYYWRVDEVNETEIPSAWAGPVWSFRIAAVLVVDDFESYGNKSPDYPYQTWLDGFGYGPDKFFPDEYGGNGTGAGIGHDIWSAGSPHFDGDIMEMERTIAGSSQSMPFYFNGASETERALAMDFTLGGAKTLSIPFRGQAGNTGRLYVKINGVKVTYPHDAANLAKAEWQAWNIDLTGLDGLESVHSLAIGIDGSHAEGMLLIDDIELHNNTEIDSYPGEDESQLVWIDLRFDRAMGAVIRPGATRKDVQTFVEGLEPPLGVAEYDAGSRIVRLVLPNDTSRSEVARLSGDYREMLAGGPLAEIGLVVTPRGAESPIILTHQFVVQLDDETPIDIDELIEGDGRITGITPNPYRINQYLLEVDRNAEVDALQVANIYHADPRTQYAVANFAIVPEFYSPNDAYFDLQWHLHHTAEHGGKEDADIDALEAWNTSRGNGVVIAVIDSVIDHEHPDLVDRLWIPGQGTVGFGTDAGSDPSHGTAVAGIVCATGNNRIGVTGVSPESKLMPLLCNIRIYDQQQAFDYARTKGADVICCAWGYHPGVRVPVNVSKAISRAARRGRERGGKRLGCVIVFAMPNDRIDIGDSPVHISALDRVIAVSGSTNEDKGDIAGFGDEMDVLAPAKSVKGINSIVTTDVRGADGYNSGSGSDLEDSDYTRRFGGTSAACAMTAGVVGLILSEDLDLEREEVWEILKVSADQIGGANYGTDGHSSTHGYGRINAEKAVQKASQ